MFPVFWEKVNEPKNLCKQNCPFPYSHEVCHTGDPVLELDFLFIFFLVGVDGFQYERFCGQLACQFLKQHFSFNNK
jgi:hypothetical protein